MKGRSEKGAKRLRDRTERPVNKVCERDSFLKRRAREEGTGGII